MAVVGQAPASAADTIRINVTDRAYQDSTGRMWEGRRGFDGGRAWSAPGRPDIAGTVDDELFRHEWVGMTSFRQELPRGTYDINLRMAEIYHNEAGSRVFDVIAEDKEVLSDIDVFKAVGKNSSYERTFRLEVTDGALNLDFSADRGLPKIGGLRIMPVSQEAAVAPPPPAPAPTPPPVVAPAPAPAPAPVPSGGRPHAGNTGVPAGTALRQHYGDLVITKPGATYDAMDIHGFVRVEAPNVTITRSIIRGGVAKGNIGLVTNYNPRATNFVLQDSELVPKHPSVWIDGVKGGNFTLRRVDARGTTDNVKVHGDNVRIENSWLHGSVYRSWDPNQGGPTHNDAVQVLGGNNIRIVGNTVEQARGSGIQVTQDFRKTTGLVIENNWVDGGGCSINLANKPRGSMRVTVSGNRFGRDQRYRNCAIIRSSGTDLSQWGNVWDDNGRGVPIISY